MAVSQERLHSLWTKITDVSHECLLREQALEVVYKALPAGEDDSVRQLLQLNHELVFVYKLLFDCGHALECMMISDTLVPRTAWSTTKLSHSQTAGYAWASFLNSSYQFREMTKAVFNQVTKVAQMLEQQKPDVACLKDALKQIEECIGQHVALRGRNTHEYVEHNKYVIGMGTFELLKRQGKKYDRGRYYVSRAKDRLRDDMQQSITSCIEVLESFYGRLEPIMSPLHREIREQVASARIELGGMNASAA